MSEPTGLTGLSIEHLEVTFGGVVAVRDLNLSAPLGRITGLIGPNGAGKSTTFNVCSGLVAASRGRVVFNGTDMSKVPRSRRARYGIGRTFQRMELFDNLSVYDNVQFGREGSLVGSSVLRQVIGRRGDAELVRKSADHAIELCGLSGVKAQRAGQLSTGRRRLVELARALAGEFRLLLLDEPSSGLDVKESQELAGLLRQAVVTTGAGILLVEHDMSVITDACDYVYVLDFGELIFEGTPDEAMASALVQSAYLGSASVSVAESAP